MNKIIIIIFIIFSINLNAQLKIGSNKSTISNNTYLEVEATSGSKIVVRKDSAMLGINNTNPNNKLEITHGTSGKSGLRFTNLTNSSSAVNSSSVSSKYLSVDNNGDVVLANSVDQVISVSGLASGLVSPVSSATFQAGTFENSYSKVDSTVLYLNQADGTTWVYSAANGGQYKSYIAPASSAWYLTSGTIDAGSNKINNIYRPGNIGLGVANLGKDTIAFYNNIGTNTYSSIVGGNYTSNGSGYLTFSTSKSNLLSERMRIDSAGLVGIGTASPVAGLHLYGNSSSGLSINVAGATAATREILFGRGGITKAAAIVGSDDGSFGGGLAFLVHGQGSDNWPTSAIQAMAITPSARVGIGVTNPTSKLEINGAATNNVAYNAGAGTTIDFSLSNLAYTSASAGAFTLTNIKDGGTYTLAVQGATSGTAAFTATGYTFKSINNGATTASKHTLYTFIVMGTNVYYYMATGF